MIIRRFFYSKQQKRSRLTKSVNLESFLEFFAKSVTSSLEGTNFCRIIEKIELLGNTSCQSDRFP